LLKVFDVIVVIALLFLSHLNNASPRLVGVLFGLGLLRSLRLTYFIFWLTMFSLALLVTHVFDSGCDSAGSVVDSLSSV